MWIQAEFAKMIVNYYEIREIDGEVIVKLQRRY